MRKFAIWWIIGVFFTVGTLLFIVNAGEIDYPEVEILIEYCDPAVTAEFADIDTCWPGELIAVPVNVSNGDSIKYLAIFLDLPGELILEDIDATGSPWNGSIHVDTVGSDINITFDSPTTFLPISSTPRRLIDMELRVSSSAGFNSSYYAGFGQLPISIFWDEEDPCLVDTSGRGSDIVIPDDSVAVILDWETAYSYQASDPADPAKADFPAVIPLYLYTNFPCSTYTLIFYQNLAYGRLVEFESKGGGAVCTTFVSNYYFKIGGCPETKPGNDSTIYLGDIKMKINSFSSDYNADCAFSDTFALGFREQIFSRHSCVYLWGAADSIGFSEIDADTGGVVLPPYDIGLAVKDANVGIDSTVDVPVTIEPSFYTQYFDIFVEFDTTYLDYETVLSAGGTIPDVNGYVKTIENNVWRTLEFEATEQTPQGKYALPDLEQTLFTIRFKAKDAFDAGMTTDIYVYDGTTYSSEVWDWFSGSSAKIKIDDGENCWSATEGTIRRPRYFCVEPGAATCYQMNTVAKIPLNVTYVNETYGDTAYLAYDFVNKADSITEADIGIDTSYSSLYWGEYGYAHTIVFDGTISGPCVMAYVWVTDLSGVNGDVFRFMNGSWIQYNSGAKKVGMTTGDPLTISCGRPKFEDFEPDLPLSYSLEQNYPNPFNANTSIGFNLREPGWTTLEIFDVLGRKVTTLLDENLAAGSHSITWNGADRSGRPVAGGVYLYILRSNGFEESRKMLYLK